MEMDLNQPIIENLDDRKGHTLREWVCMESPSREIYRRFRLFLTTFVDARGNNVHAEKIRVMCESNRESLIIRQDTPSGFFFFFFPLFFCFFFFNVCV